MVKKKNFLPPVEENVKVTDGKIVAYIPDNGRLKDDGDQETNWFNRKDKRPAINK
jgi:hypothetical protein